MGKIAKANFPGFGYHLPSFTYRLINPFIKNDDFAWLC